MNEYEALVAEVAERTEVPDLVDLARAAEAGFNADTFSNDVATSHQFYKEKA